MKTEFRNGAHFVLPRDKFQLTVIAPTGKAILAHSEQMEALIGLNQQFQTLGYTFDSLQKVA